MKKSKAGKAMSGSSKFTTGSSTNRPMKHKGKWIKSHFSPMVSNNAQNLNFQQNSCMKGPSTFDQVLNKAAAMS
jgi:hypothetical protein